VCFEGYLIAVNAQDSEGQGPLHLYNQRSGAPPYLLNVAFAVFAAFAAAAAAAAAATLR